jgi:hypothetical protein
VCSFRLPHTLRIGRQFSESSDISNTLEFGIRYSASSSLDLVYFFDADFAGCGIDRKSISCHFLDFLSFAGLLVNNLQLLNPPQRLSM